MKTYRLIFPLVVALAAMIASTGCKHGPTKLTNLPGQQRYVPGPTGDNVNTLPSSQPLPDFNNSNVNTANLPPGTTPTVDSWDPANMTQDRTALASHMVHFKFDSSVVVDEEQSNVSAVASFMAGDATAKLLIEGHCDERGTEEYNRSLGERRALALREALAKAGVGADRVRTISFGKDKPADFGHDEAAWAKNRRGEFVVCRPK